MVIENKNKSFRGIYFMLTEWPDALGRFAFFNNMTAAELRASEEGLGDNLTNTARKKFEEILSADSFVSLCMETGENGASHFHYVVGVRNAISSNTIRKAFLFKDSNGKKCKVLSITGEEKETLVQIKKLQVSIGRACQYLDKTEGEFIRSDGSDKRDTRETGVLHAMGAYEEWKAANKRGSSEGGRTYKQSDEVKFNKRAVGFLMKYYKNGAFDFESFKVDEADYANDEDFMDRFWKILYRG